MRIKYDEFWNNQKLQQLQILHNQHYNDTTFKILTKILSFSTIKDNRKEKGIKTKEKEEK